MKNYVYLRISTETQSFNAQLEYLKEQRIQEDKKTIFVKEVITSRAKLKERKELQKILEKMVLGDVLTVTKLDRLARNVSDVLEVAEILKNKGCNLKIINFPIDTTSDLGKLFMTIAGAFADFEREMIAEKTKQGIEAAKLAKKFKGGARRFSKETIMEIQHNHKVRKWTYTELQQYYKCSQTTLAKYIHIDVNTLSDTDKIFKKK